MRSLLQQKAAGKSASSLDHYWSTDLSQVLKYSNTCRGEEIKYSTKKETAANSEGVIAYRAGMKDEALKLISSQINV